MCLLCRKTQGLWITFLVTYYTSEVTVNRMNSTFSLVHYNQSMRWTDTRKNSGPFLCSWGPKAGLVIIGFWANSQSLVQWFVKMMPQDQYQGSQLNLYITETCWWPTGTLTLGQFNSSARVFKTCYFRHHELYLEYVMVSLHCPLHWICNHLGDTSPDMSTRMFAGRFTWGGRLILNVRWEAELNKSEKVESSEPQSSTPSASCLWVLLPHASLPWWMGPLTVIWNKPFLLQVALVSCSLTRVTDL